MNSESVSSLASSLSTFDPTRESHLDHSLLYLSNSDLALQRLASAPNVRQSIKSVSDSSSHIGLGLNLDFTQSTSLTNHTNDESTSYLRTDITFTNNHRSYPSEISLPDESSSPLVDPGLSPGSSIYTPRTPTKTPAIDACSTPVDSFRQGFAATAITTGPATGTTIGARSGNSHLSPTIYSPNTEYSPVIQLPINPIKDPMRGNFHNASDIWNLPHKINSKIIDVAHPVNYNMPFTIRKRDLGIEEIEAIKQSTDQENPVIHGLVPIYDSPNIDSLSNFPYKNSLTPPLITRTLSWHTNDTESSFSSREALVRFNDEPQVYVTPSASDDGLTQLRIPRTRGGNKDQDKLNEPELESPEILNWRSQYPRDITVASMLRSTNSNPNLQSVPNPSPKLVPPSSSLQSMTPPTLYAAGFPVLPDLPFTSKHSRYQGIRGGGKLPDSEKYGGYENLNPYGLPMVSKLTSRFIIMFCILFPPLWFLLGTGFFDRVIGVVPVFEKRISLLCGTIFFLVVIACIAIGLDLGSSN